MAPIKFEENIKDKLEKRRLEPSSQAWNRLSEKLEADSKRTPNKTIWLLAIAASLVGIFFMVNVFLNTSETSNNEPVLVDTETNEVESIQSKMVMETDETLVAVEENTAEVENISKEKIKTNGSERKPEISKKNQLKNTSLAQVEANQKPEETDKNTLIETVSTNLELAQINNQEKANKTETEVDVLLKKAQQNLANNTNNISHKIVAQALLQDVEEDIESSFRDKVFETLITGYKKVKTAVAERNE